MVAGVLLGALAAGGTSAAQSTMNTINAKERAEGWRLLFDGQTTAGWRGFRQPTLPAGWQAIDGELTRVGEAGDIVTVDEFDDFELTLEWKLSPNGNSGLFYRVTEDDDVMWHTAPEYQIIDNAVQGAAEGGAVHRRELRSASPVARRHQTDRHVEPDPPVGARCACRALAERCEGGRVRAVDARLGAASQGRASSRITRPTVGRGAATSDCRTTAIAPPTGTSRSGRVGRVGPAGERPARQIRYLSYPASTSSSYARHTSSGMSWGI